MGANPLQIGLKPATLFFRFGQKSTSGQVHLAAGTPVFGGHALIKMSEVMKMILKVT